MKIAVIAAVLALGCKTESKSEHAHTAGQTVLTKTRPVKPLPAPRHPGESATPSDPVTSMIMPPQFLSEHPGWRPPDHDPKSLYPGSLPVDDVFDKYWGLLEWGNRYVTAPGNPALVACRAAWEARGNKVNADLPLALHIVGDGTRLEVVEVLTEFADWPEALTDADKTCIVNAYAHRGQDSPIVADVTVDYPVSVSASEEPKR
jgi:hypothetical protein